MTKYNETQEGLVTCFECGAKRRSLAQHVKKHGMTIKAYKSKYPDSKISCDETRRLHQENGTRVMKSVYNNPESLEKLKKSRSENAKNQWATNKKFVEKMREVGREVMARDHKSMVEKSMNAQLKEYTLTNGDIVRLRSGFEYRVYDFLVRNEIKFEYESLWIPYLYGDSLKHYKPDFFLPDLNLILEVKPTCYINSSKNQAKKSAVESLGYRFEWVTQNDYWSDEKLNSLVCNHVT